MGGLLTSVLGSRAMVPDNACDGATQSTAWPVAHTRVLVTTDSYSPSLRPVSRASLLGGPRLRSRRRSDFLTRTMRGRVNVASHYSARSTGRRQIVSLILRSIALPLSLRPSGLCACVGDDGRQSE